MRIDSHVCRSESHPPAHLKAILERNRFDGGILFVDGPLLPAVEAPTLGLVVRNSPLDAATLDRYRDHPAVRGVSASLRHGVPDGVEELARRQLRLDVEMEPGDFPALLDLAGRLPDLAIAIDHLARPDFSQGITPEWARGMEAAAGLPRVFCKISGLLTGSAALPWSAAPIRPFVQHALTVFGPGRLMFGSEWPVRLPDVSWKESLAAFTQSIGAQSMEVREQLLGETARTFYGL